MKLQIERPHIAAMIEAFPRLAFVQEQLRFGNKVELAFNLLSDEELDFLRGLYADGGPELRARAAQIATLQKALHDVGTRFAAEDLEMLVPAIARYLAEDSSRGWVFSAHITGKPLAYVVTRLDFTPPSDEETGKVFIELKANAKARLATATLRIAGPDVAGRTVAEIFAAKGFVKETPALLKSYDETAARYFDWRAQYGAQFSGSGVGYFAENPTATHRDTDYSRKDLIILSSTGSAARLVNDESILGERVLALDPTGDIMCKFVRRIARNSRLSGKDEAEVEATQATLPKGMFTELPVHFYMLMFHLELHHYLWVHVDDMQPYRYQPELKDKLVLPPEQTDLIDILTAEMDVLMDDIVAGKSGGTTVLCAGPAGVGKTLTAEVYSEIIKRPLYRVHSGQLGLNVAAMETALKEVLTRAQRWGAVMLIDEADVYIKKRDDNITMNAVVGVFLRVLEYFNGLLFLTTNRVDDIDEAIVSRCIALIKFHPPGREDRRRIWGVMTEQFGLLIEPDLLERLPDIFPEATGRDIKGLAKLVTKYCNQKALPPTVDVFRRCSIFRGMEVAA
ncbi:AAA family ATPase [Dechloromonas denitrificans]|uniref:AAA family ATPase n=1 Tax=Dechloromonas denitrificans TaxID=281362 RepID=UPI001CF7F2FD|nr:ATP-binding protein [Dechloromonas denitrificans]UCV04868.1 AAA family ATPase [Dechloromonas denitrificans]